MPNSGPPFFAADAAEAARTLEHQQSARRRAEFQKNEQVALMGDPAKQVTLLQNWDPLINRKKGR